MISLNYLAYHTVGTQNHYLSYNVLSYVHCAGVCLYEKCTNQDTMDALIVSIATDTLRNDLNYISAFTQNCLLIYSVWYTCQSN